MAEGSTGGDRATPVPACPLCRGTGQRHIRRPGDPRKQLRLTPCRCALARKDTDQ